jgi:hypothetical protein
MSQNKPYHRTYRKIKEGENSGYSDWAYILDKEYSNEPEHYTRAFSIIQQDIMKVFEFIEPSGVNNKVYSFRIHELLMRTCIEIEANFKAILRENIYSPVYKKGPNKGKARTEDSWNINDFKIVNKTHHLDNYSIEIPIWKGDNKIRKPFIDWKNDKPLKWYQSYNNSKHDRINKFQEANFENLMDAFCGLFALLSSQFRTEDFFPGESLMSFGSNGYYKGSFGIGGFLMVNFPKNWSEDELYEFNWSDLGKESVKFQKINYNET